MESIFLAVKSALAEGMLWSVMAIGVYITYTIMKLSDLTVDGSFALGACVSVMFVTRGVNPVLSLALTLLIGGIAGITTGLLHTKLKIPAILSGILTMIALYSINIKILGNRANLPLKKEETVFSMVAEGLNLSKNGANLLIGTIITGLVIVVLYWFFGTEIGSAIRATGNNESMSKAQGVNIDFTKILGLAISNALVALSGGMVSQAQGYADIGMGTGTIVIGLASVVIGGVLIGSGRNFAAQLIGTSLGSVFYRIVIAAALQIGVKEVVLVIFGRIVKFNIGFTTNDMKLLTAIIVAIALSVPLIRKKVNGGRVAKKQGAK